MSTRYCLIKLIVLSVFSLTVNALCGTCIKDLRVNKVPPHKNPFCM